MNATKDIIDKLFEEVHQFDGVQGLLHDGLTSNEMARELGNAIRAKINEKNSNIDKEKGYEGRYHFSSWFRPTGLIKTWNQGLKDKYHSRLKGEYRLGLARLLRGPFGRKLARAKKTLTGQSESSSLHISCEPNFESLIQIESGTNKGKYFPANRVQGHEFGKGKKTRSRRDMLVSSAPVVHAGIKEYTRLLAQEVKDGHPEIFHLSMVFSEFNKFLSMFTEKNDYESPKIKIGNESFYIREKRSSNTKHIGINTFRISNGNEDLGSIAAVTRTNVAYQFTSNRKGSMESLHVKEFELVKIDQRGMKKATPLHYAFYPNYHDNMAYTYDTHKMEPLVKYYEWIRTREVEHNNLGKSFLLFNCKCGANRSQAVMAGQMIYETLQESLTRSLDGLSRNKQKAQIIEFQREITGDAKKLALSMMLYVGMSSQSPQFSQVENVTNMVKASAQHLAKQAWQDLSRNEPLPPELGGQALRLAQRRKAFTERL